MKAIMEERKGMIKRDGNRMWFEEKEKEEEEEEENFND